MMNEKCKFFVGNWQIVAALAVLLAGVGVVMHSAFGDAAEVIHGDLIDGLPTAAVPWTQVDLDIASTEEMKRAVNELLNYDQAVFRQYKRGDLGFSLYVAHWQPRKFHPRLISIHTPDICWVENGWKMEAADYSYPFHLAGGYSWPAQYREFTINGKRTYVLYWHIMNGKLSGYASGPDSASRSFIERLWADIAEGTGEQFFIRLSSEQPWGRLKEELFFNSVMSTFSPVLLAK